LVEINKFHSWTFSCDWHKYSARLISDWKLTTYICKEGSNVRITCAALPKAKFSPCKPKILYETAHAFAKPQFSSPGHSNVVLLSNPFRAQSSI